MNGTTAKIFQILVNAEWMEQSISVQLHKLQGFHPEETELKLDIAWLAGVFVACSQRKIDSPKWFPAENSKFAEIFFACLKELFLWRAPSQL